MQKPFEGISLPLMIFGSCFYFVAYALSFIGNCFVLTICYRRRASSLKWFIANLAVADLTFTLLTILDAISFLWNWIGGQVSCKIQGFFIVASWNASIMTLVVISYERVKAVVDPFNARFIDSVSASKKVISLWVISLAFGSPLLHAYRIVREEESGKAVCSNEPFGDLERQIYFGIHGVCFFLIPLIYMLYAQFTIFRTLRSRAQRFPGKSCLNTKLKCRHRKVAKTLTALTLAFVICWSPFVIFRMLKYFHLWHEKHFWRSSQLLTLVNSALDPILYGIYGENLSSKQVFGGIVKCFAFIRPSARVRIFTTTETTRNQQNTKIDASTRARFNIRKSPIGDIGKLEIRSLRLSPNFNVLKK
ncbi:PREDICTED: neuropeptide S receptor-like [Acropora digitifera]|uniref:neuropeptide S receptor-like n=1 Tax=Acropora digitifera TaxID=70779 RepID=UPI00077B0CCA|nr:PREDICTED: neuropeptide S receptor-like [Acropora digitifera]